MHDPSDTRERILQAALSLIGKRGVKGATTLAIAKEAGVNEVTIFRHFQNKEGLLQAAVKRVSYVPSIKKFIRQNVTGVLEEDLYLFANTYHRLLQENAELILIGLRESEFSEKLDTVGKESARAFNNCLLR